MEPAQASKLLNEKALDRPESFYGLAAGLALGAGLIVDGVEFAAYDPSEDRFRVLKGLVYVLSHECDLDQDNERLLNQSGLICPIIRIETIIREAAAAELPDHFMGAFLGNLANRAVSRAVYMPPIADHLPHGGILYLNEMTSTPVGRLKAGIPIAAVTAAGLLAIDASIENHFRRPKSDRLPLSGATIRKAVSIGG